MALTANPASRPPIWGKSMSRFLGGTTPESKKGDPKVDLEPPRNEPVLSGVNEKAMVQLGLKVPPADPRLLATFLVSEDAADAEADADNFARGIRRAVRLSLALTAGLHRKAGMQWREWVERTFKVGYACFNRYHVAAQIQIELITRGLPLLSSETQSRSIAAFRKHERLWDALGAPSFNGGYPAGNELKTRLRSLLGIKAIEKAGTPRIRLHRTLAKILAQMPSSEESPVAEALVLIRRAISILEKGATS